MRSNEDLKNDLLNLNQLMTMAKKTLKAATNAEYLANVAKLEAMKPVAELKVRIEILEDQLGIERPEEVSERTREDALADNADNANKLQDEHETHPGAA